ncbi:hypothetical protein [Polynucleobacter sp. IMCC 29146]|uniref:hypothetical protein n=1 Tax=Polynucleobacter sp. IMCC 29146 TaxID=2780953 RepID=UPI001F317B7F|nr:hypothetical protein [Polynucleobacter sp. IMCC 29146]MCE7530194.1 hypothetical protein [Polynucleobacter sp. IMCC 29146]
MKFAIGMLCTASVIALSPMANAHEQDTSGRQDVLNIETSDLPQGKVKITAIERTHPPGARTPWHTSGPKLIHIMQGTLTAYGLGGRLLNTCGPAPKVCFFNPNEEMWYFRNNGQTPMRFMLISIDALDKLTIHEEVGQVSAIKNRQVTLMAGDLMSGRLAAPEREVIVNVVDLPTNLAVGDRVVTVRHDAKNHKARTLVKLQTEWQ